MEHKYLKYKEKYLSLKKQIGGMIHYIPSNEVFNNTVFETSREKYDTKFALFNVNQHPIHYDTSKIPTQNKISDLNNGIIFSRLNPTTTFPQINNYKFTWDPIFNPIYNIEESKPITFTSNLLAMVLGLPYDKRLLQKLLTDKRVILFDFANIIGKILGDLDFIPNIGMANRDDEKKEFIIKIFINLFKNNENCLYIIIAKPYRNITIDEIILEYVKRESNVRPNYFKEKCIILTTNYYTNVEPGDLDAVANDISKEVTKSTRVSDTYVKSIFKTFSDSLKTDIENLKTAIEHHMKYIKKERDDVSSAIVKTLGIKAKEATLDVATTKKLYDDALPYIVEKAIVKLARDVTAPIAADAAAATATAVAAADAAAAAVAAVKSTAVGGEHVRTTAAATAATAAATAAADAAAAVADAAVETVRTVEHAVFKHFRVDLPIPGGLDDYILWLLTISLWNITKECHGHLMVVTEDRQKIFTDFDNIARGKKTILSNMLPTQDVIDSYNIGKKIKYKKDDIKINVSFKDIQILPDSTKRVVTNIDYPAINYLNIFWDLMKREKYTNTTNNTTGLIYELDPVGISPIMTNLNDFVVFKNEIHEKYKKHMQNLTITTKYVNDWLPECKPQNIYIKEVPTNFIMANSLKMIYYIRLIQTYLFGDVELALNKQEIYDIFQLTFIDPLASVASRIIIGVQGSIVLNWDTTRRLV